MDKVASRYIIVGLTVEGGKVNEGMTAIQASVEKLVGDGYQPVGGVAMCIDAGGAVHLSQAVFAFGQLKQRILVSEPVVA